MFAIPVPQKLINQAHSNVYKVTLKSGETARHTNGKCTDLWVVMKGCLRVYKRSEDGRMFTLYRVNAGECCGLSVSCIINKTTFPAVIEVEEDILAYAIPASMVRRFMHNNIEWQAYLFTQMGKKIRQLTDLTENLVFNNMESRIANLLCLRLRNNDNKTTLQVTHQLIANEIGTSREVASRSLNHLEAKGYLELRRGEIKVTNYNALKQFSTIH